MKPVNEQINKIVRNERLHLLRSCCFVLGGLCLLAALLALGFGGIGNPKSASSFFSAFALSGYLRPFAMPLAILGLCAIIAGAVTTIARSHHSSGPPNGTP